MDEQVCPPLPLSNPTGSAHLVAAVDSNNLVLLSELLQEEGVAVINQPDEQLHCRPLEVACQKGFPDLVQLLLQHGADANLPADRFSNIPLVPPLLIALSHGGGVGTKQQEDTVRVLLEHGNCDPNIMRGGKSALIWACGHASLMTLLIRAGASADCADAMGRTAVQFAVMARDVDSLEVLIAAGAPLEKPNSKGDVPLHRAARDGHLGSLRCLLEAGCDPDVPNTLRKYDTPLYSACVSGFPSIIQALLEYGADPRPAALYHLHSNHYDINTLLLIIRYGADVDYRHSQAALSASSTVLTAICKGWFEAAKVLLLAGAERTADLDAAVKAFSSTSQPEVAEFAEWYWSQPGGRCPGSSSLKQLCRLYTRSLLLPTRRSKGSLPSQLQALPVPKPIRGYLCFEDL